MTRHPLALLADKWRAAAGPVYGPEEAVFQQCADELESALRAQAEAEGGLQAENAALRRKISRIESVKRFMAEQIARRTPASFYEAVAELDRALAEPLYDPQTGALAQAGAGEGQGEE